MNIADLKDYKIVSAPDTPQTNSPQLGGITNISQLNGNYQTGPDTSTQQPQQQQPEMPILTNQNGGFGTALKDVTVGAGKDLISTARDTAGLFQSAGRFVANKVGITPLPTGETNPQLGFQSVDNSTPEGSQIDQQLQSKSRGEQVGKVLSFVGQMGTGFATKEGVQAVAKGGELYKGYQASREAKATQEATGKVSEMISPKATVKQAKIAQSEGRLVQGKEPTLFRAGTEDKILPSKKTLSASETVVKNIPNASKMSPPDLYKAVDSKITETAKALRPEMEKTPIKPETIQKINDDWSALKKVQMEDAPATEEANVAKRQAKFESLLRKSGSGNHADLWDTRINYDNSIPTGVKQATSISPESLQLQKEEWLQNRAILNNAINDTASGMGKTSQKAFNDMSNLYEAKNGLLSKAKVNEALPSKFNQFLKKHPVVSGAVGGGTLYGAAKKLGVPLP